MQVAKTPVISQPGMEWEEVPPAKGGTKEDNTGKEDDGVTEVHSDHKADEGNNEGSKPHAIEETPMITDNCNDDMQLQLRHHHQLWTVLATNESTHP
jgi:hypothetical protein